MDKKLLFLLSSISLASYFISLIIFKTDTSFSYKWLTLFFSLLPLATLSFLWVYSLRNHRKILASINIYGFLFIFFLALVSRLSFLTNYPFVSVGDELRDGGLNAEQIVTGQIKNIFGYGKYEAHGLIIPTFTSFFYRIFGNSVLVYRLPAAIVSIFDILLFYLLLSFLIKSKSASLLGTMILISLPLHLFFSRTEIVVILSSLFSTLILLALFVFRKRKMENLIDYILLGTLLGFTFNLHASIKAFSLIVLTVIIFINLYQLLFKKLKIGKFSIRLFFLILFLFVGFGPRLFNTDLNIFFHTSAISFASGTHLELKPSNLKKIASDYKKSLLVWIIQPTISHYWDFKPIFSEILFSLMILGILTGLAKRDSFLIIVFFIALISHLTNSALTNLINTDYRLSPLYPIGCLFAGIGISVLIGATEQIRFRFLKYTFIFLLFVFLSTQLFLFFAQQPANKKYKIEDYLSMHAIYFIKANKLDQNRSLVLFVSQNNFQKLNYLHYKEQYMFFFPKTEITIKENKSLKNNQIYIKNSDSDDYAGDYIVNCNGRDFFCPINYSGSIEIHYQI